MGSVSFEGFGSEAHLRRQPSVVASQQLAKGGGGEQALDLVSRRVPDRRRLAGVKIGGDMTPEGAVVAEHPSPKFSVLSLLGMARTVVGRLVQDRRQPVEANSKQGQLILALGKRLIGRDSREVGTGEGAETNPQSSGESQHRAAAAIGEGSAFVQSLPP